MRNRLIIVIVVLLVFLNLNAEELCKERLPQSINSFALTIVPVISPDGKFLYFDRKTHPENIGGIYDNDEIWFSELKKGRYWTLPKQSESINTKDSDVLFSISPDGNKALVYGTNGIINNNRFSLLKREENVFSKYESINIKDYKNTSDNFYAHLNSSENIIFLSLDNKDSYGQSDIFISSFDKEKRSWSKPMNIRGIINTEGDELSPCLSNDGFTLYFSSNGHNSYGGYDLFMTKRLDDTWRNWSDPVNMGGTINSQFNETSFSTNLTNDTAYIISSEFKRIPSEDERKIHDTLFFKHGIYRVCIPEAKQPLPYLIFKGKVKKYIGEKEYPIKQIIDFKVELSNKNHSDFFYRSINGKGEYTIIIPAKTKANITVETQGFEQKELSFSTINLDNTKTITQDIILEPKVKNKNTEAQLFYYETNECLLDENHKKKIEKVLSSLDNISSIKFKIIGHADEQGSDEYNYELSLNRAKSILQYMVDLGIDEKMISLIGRGEKEPVSKDAASNRRVELIIIR